MYLLCEKVYNYFWYINSHKKYKSIFVDRWNSSNLVIIGALRLFAQLFVLASLSVQSQTELCYTS